MLTHPSIPRRSDGALDVCQDCQWRICHMAGGYLEMLAHQLERLAVRAQQARNLTWPSLRRLKAGESREFHVIDSSPAFADALWRNAKRAAEAGGWDVRLTRKGPRIVVTRLN